MKMHYLTKDAKLVCAHELGTVPKIKSSQNLVTINGQPMLVEKDPEKKQIIGCPNFGTTIKPCLVTYHAETGYSNLVRINGRRVCVDTLTGLTDGTPPGAVKYKVHHAGQDLVSEKQ